MPGNKKGGGLLDMLFGEEKHGTKSRQQSQPRQQHGGAVGDGYAWHRKNAINNLRGEGENKRNAWLDEVRAVQAETGLEWKSALQEASKRRKAGNGSYKTWKQRVVKGYTGRQASQVKCAAGKKCPGKYSKPASATYRQGAHASKRPLSQQAAVKQLRSHYRARGLASGDEKGLKKATMAMRQDITKKRKGKPLQPCPTRIITVKRKDGTTHQRRIAKKTEACADSWLYRGKGVTRHDMAGVDHGNKDRSDAYGKRRLYAKNK